MIHFSPDSADGRLLAELKDAGVLTPDLIDHTYSAMGRPDSGTLDDFLSAGADFIPDNDWLSWLIRRHGCHRFGRVAWQESAAGWRNGDAPCDGNIPYRICADDKVFVAVSRPDRFDAIRKRLKDSRPLWVAATLREIRELKRPADNRGGPLEGSYWAIRSASL